MQAGELHERLHAKYPAPEWASFDELRDGPGFSAARTIDFFTVNTWPSKGMCAIAVEVKVSRADFRRELDKPEKRLAVVPYVNEFWFAAPKGIIPVEELPEGCGLYETWGEKLRATRRAKQFMDREPDRALWTVIARRCADMRADAAKVVGEFAEFRGRTVSIADLKRLATKAGALFPVRQKIREEVMAEVRSLRRRDSLLTEDWLSTLHEIRREASSWLGLDWKDKPTPGQCLAFLRKGLASREFNGLAGQLRRLADKLEGTSCAH